jgi:DNA/RNA endonuclease G (NUC1)
MTPAPYHDDDTPDLRFMAKLCAYVALFLLAWGVAEAAGADLSNVARPIVRQPVPGFAYAHSPVTGSAIWTAEILGDFKPDKGNRPAFYVDRNIPPELRATPSDYDEPVYDAGHLAAHGNAADQAGRIARAAASNIVPEKPGFNRGICNQFEQIARSLKTPENHVAIITVPIYYYRTEAPNPLFIGKGKVFIPTHVAKVVYVGKGGEEPDFSTWEPMQLLCWLAPNRTTIGAPSAYRTTLAAVESASQLDILPDLDAETVKRLEPVK